MDKNTWRMKKHVHSWNKCHEKCWFYGTYNTQHVLKMWVHWSSAENGTTVMLSLKTSILTLWEPGYDIFVLQFRPKTNSCQLPYQHLSSSADCPRELFKGSNESDNLLVCTQKKFFGWGLRIFCAWRHKWGSFWAILAHVAWPRAQPLGQSVSLKF